MTPEEMAALHARAFAGQGQVWSAAEFASLCASDLVFVVGGANAFALGRVIVDEAELLTLATDPDQRRKGLGRAILARFEAEAGRRGALRAFLEVAAGNEAALALYRAAGYDHVARRAGYYSAPDGGREDALILEKQLA